MLNTAFEERALAPGQGALRVSAVAGRSTVVEARASNPLKLLVPQHQGQSAWVYTTGFGGGMLSCDCIDLSVHVESEACAFLGTQASTKIYKRSQPQDKAQQFMDMTVDSQACLISLPDPVACFTDANFEQRQDFHLHNSSSLFAVDWFSAGRMARGESWDMHHLSSRLRYFVDGRLMVEDPMHLRSHSPALRSLQNIAVFGTTLIVGERMQPILHALSADIDAQAMKAECPSIESYSPIEGGIMWRFAATSIDHMYERIYSYVDLLADVCGDKPWRRRP